MDLENEIIELNSQLLQMKAWQNSGSDSLKFYATNVVSVDFSGSFDAMYKEITLEFVPASEKEALVQFFPLNKMPFFDFPFNVPLTDGYTIKVLPWTDGTSFYKNKAEVYASNYYEGLGDRTLTFVALSTQPGLLKATVTRTESVTY